MQTIEGEGWMQHVNQVGVLGEESGEATRRDDAGAGIVDLGFLAADQAFEHAKAAPEEAAFHRVARVFADGEGRRGKLDTREIARGAGECIREKADTGANRPTEEVAVRVEGFPLGGRA